MRELRKETETTTKTSSYILCLTFIRNERTPKGDGNLKIEAVGIDKIYIE